MEENKGSISPRKMYINTHTIFVRRFPGCREARETTSEAPRASAPSVKVPPQSSLWRTPRALGVDSTYVAVRFDSCSRCLRSLAEPRVFIRSPGEVTVPSVRGVTSRGGRGFPNLLGKPVADPPTELASEQRTKGAFILSWPDSANPFSGPVLLSPS